MSHGVIAVAGSLAQIPRQGGLAWLHLQFLLGLRRLGWDVLFLDRLSPEMCVDETGRAALFEEALNVRYFLRVMQDFGLGEAFSLNFNCGERVIGLSRKELMERVAGAAVLLNVMG